MDNEIGSAARNVRGLPKISSEPAWLEGDLRRILGTGLAFRPLFEKTDLGKIIDCVMRMDVPNKHEEVSEGLLRRSRRSSIEIQFFSKEGAYARPVLNLVLRRMGERQKLNEIITHLSG